MDVPERGLIFALAQHTIRWLGTERTRRPDHRRREDGLENVGPICGPSGLNPPSGKRLSCERQGSTLAKAFLPVPWGADIFLSGYAALLISFAIENASNDFNPC